MSNRIQLACETLEKLIKRDRIDKVLTMLEFLALNTVLLEMSHRAGYKVPEELMK